MAERVYLSEGKLITDRGDVVDLDATESLGAVVDGTPAP